MDLVKTTIGINSSPDIWNRVTNKEDAARHGLTRYDRHILANAGPDGKRIYNDEEIEAAYNIIELCH